MNAWRILPLAALILISPTLPARTIPRPERLTISGEEWRVEWTHKDIVHHHALYYGWTDCYNRVITASLNETPSQQADTLVHEVLHAITCKDGDVHNERYNNGAQSHDGIYFAAPRLARFIQDNAEAVRWIQAMRESALQPGDCPASEARCR